MKTTTSKTIEVVVATDGTTKLITKGFPGSQCLDASRFLELALGKKVDDQLTSEYHDIKGREKARARRRAMEN